MPLTLCLPGRCKWVYLHDAQRMQERLYAFWYIGEKAVSVEEELGYPPQFEGTFRLGLLQYWDFRDVYRGDGN